AAEDAVQEAVASLPLAQTVTTNTLTFDPTLLPVVTFDLQGDLSQAELTEIAQTRLVPELSNLDGVASVEVVGGSLDQVIITLDRQAMLDQNITYDQVSGVLQANNVVLPSGQLQTEGATIPLQTISIYQSLDDLRNLPITTANGTVRLGDIATVEEIAGASAGRTRTNGEPSVAVRVTKQQDANTVSVAHRVLDKLDEIERTLPEGASIQIFLDQDEFIEESIDGVVEEAIIGGVLAIIIVFLFLWNIRSTVIT